MLEGNEYSIVVANHSSNDYQKLLLPYIEACNIDNEIKPVGFDYYDSDFVDNISHKNKTYCELSVLYSFWKQNLITETFGLAHYRRLFSLSDDYAALDVIIKSFDDRFLFSENQKKFIEKYKNSVVVGYTGLVGGSIWNQFKITHSDLFEFFAFACEKFGFLFPQMGNPISFFQTHAHLNHCNMFIAPRNIVEQWCNIIFPFLESIENHAPENLDGYSLRWAGFFSERFFTYFISSIQDSVNVVIKPIVLFQ